MPATITRPAREVLTEGIAKVGGWPVVLEHSKGIVWSNDRASIGVSFALDGTFTTALLVTGAVNETTADAAQLLNWFATYGA